MFDSQPSPVSPEEEPATSRDESGEPSGDEDPGVEREILEEKESDSVAAPPAEPAASRTADSSPEDSLAQAQREGRPDPDQRDRRRGGVHQGERDVQPAVPVGA